MAMCVGSIPVKNHDDSGIASGEKMASVEYAWRFFFVMRSTMKPRSDAPLFEYA